MRSGRTREPWRWPAPGSALRRAFAAGYGRAQLRADVLAGLVVGVVALPLSMALAIASGVPPQHGLYTAIVAALCVAPLGGSRVQVTGPTAAFVVLLAPVSAQYGVAGLACASLMAGLFLLLMAGARLGRLIAFVPSPVTIGFTAGIAVTIAVLQCKDLFGLAPEALATDAHLPARAWALAQAATTWRWTEAVLGVGTIALLVVAPRVVRGVPAPVVVLPLVAIAAWAVQLGWPAFRCDTIAARFGGLTAGLPRLGWPWLLPGPPGAPFELSLATIRALLPAAFAIAMLGAIESLLSAVVADGLVEDRHDPDGELLALGTGNIVAPFLGGFALTGALARTATNARAGAVSPIAAVVHGVVLVGALGVCGPLLAQLPMAALAGLLCVVAWNMSEARHFWHLLRHAPAGDVGVLLTCFGLTVIFDMVLAVSVGVVLAALIFMRRMADLAVLEVHPANGDATHAELPPGVAVYTLRGPIFFGAAQRALHALTIAQPDVQAVVVDMGHVPLVDATGVANLSSACAGLQRRHVRVILAACTRPVRLALRRAGLLGPRDGPHHAKTVADAVARATPPRGV